MSASITVEEAQATLKELIGKLAPGDEIVITDNEQPVAKLTTTAKPTKRQLGTMKGTVLYMAPDFDASEVMTLNRTKRNRDKEYAAKLLFQFRFGSKNRSNKRRLCEERILRFQASSAKVALATAKRKGREAQHKYLNSDGNAVHFEFVGVMDLLHLGPECEEDEVWYEFFARLSPMEKKRKFIPTDLELISQLPTSKK
jgi:antitoxin (DNA-binding transcriptional repressor) of toxin-antitoxin stability system